MRALKNSPLKFNWHSSCLMSLQWLDLMVWARYNDLITGCNQLQNGNLELLQVLKLFHSEIYLSRLHFSLLRCVFWSIKSCSRDLFWFWCLISSCLFLCLTGIVRYENKDSHFDCLRVDYRNFWQCLKFIFKVVNLFIVLAI